MDDNLKRRFHTDAAFHDLVSRLALTIRDGHFEAADLRSAIEMAEEINRQFFAVEDIAGRKSWGLEVLTMPTTGDDPFGSWIPYDASYYQTREAAERAAERKMRDSGRGIKIRACEVLPPID
jgi:hypothetical protein